MEERVRLGSKGGLDHGVARAPCATESMCLFGQFEGTIAQSKLNTVVSGPLLTNLSLIRLSIMLLRFSDPRDPAGRFPLSCRITYGGTQLKGIIWADAPATAAENMRAVVRCIATCYLT